MRQNILKRKLNLRIKRKRRVRAKISGTSDLVRVSIFKSNRAIYAQAIDDVNGVTLASVNGNIRRGNFSSCKAEIRTTRRI